MLTKHLQTCLLKPPITKLRGHSKVPSLDRFPGKSIKSKMLSYLQQYKRIILAKATFSVLELLIILQNIQTSSMIIDPEMSTAVNGTKSNCSSTYGWQKVSF